MRKFIPILLMSLCTLPAFTHAAEDAPGRVARLSHLQGEVSMAPAGTQEWGEAVLNRPLTSEDRLFVDRDGRAELQVGSASVHLDANTEFSFIDLDDDAMTMSLSGGTATIRILRKRDNEIIEVNTPNASVALNRPGEYHIEVNDEGDQTIVKTRSGEAEIAGEENIFTVKSNETGVFRGTEELAGDITRIGPRTAFENWANDRARREERSASSRYVGEDVIGYEDLDDHGEWISEPEYGHVWRPTRVVSTWAPYRDGRWAWVSPWGWTWIDNSPWGFAPFHYGRWAMVSDRWCWVPGPRHVRAVYAPALVAWTGSPHVSVNVSVGGGIGWFPLGPREVYVPGYWHSRRYIHNVNYSNTVIVNNIYINNAYRGRHRDFDYRYRNRPDAVTIVNREHFVRGQPLNGRLARVDERELRNWRNDARPPAIAPDRDSIRAGQPRSPTRRTFDRADGTSRAVVARRDVPNRVDFDAERRAVEANGGRPVARTQLLDRKPKDRGDFRTVRARIPERNREQGNGVGRSQDTGSAPQIADEGRQPRARGGDRQRGVERNDDASQRSEASRAERATRDEARRQPRGSQPQIQSMPATEEAPRTQRQERSLDRGTRSDTGGSASIEARQEARRQRNSSDSSDQARARQAPEQSQVFEQRQRDSAPEAQRNVQREAQREAFNRERAQNVERRNERSHSAPQRSSAPEPRTQQRIEQPQQSQQPRMERSPAPERAAPQSRSDSNSRNSERSNQMRSERGGSRDR